MKTKEYYINMETRLNIAKDKCHAVLCKYYEQGHGDKWNEWLDLHDRIIRRLLDNLHEYRHWHFEQYGWTTC